MTELATDKREEAKQRMAYARAVKAKRQEEAKAAEATESQVPDGSYKGSGVLRPRELATCVMMYLPTEGPVKDMLDFTLRHRADDGFGISYRMAKVLGINPGDEVEVTLRVVKRKEG